MSENPFVLLSTAYFGPIHYFTKFLQYKVIIEKHESYSKQSFRNRCVIYGANGPLTLVVPVINEHGKKTKINDVLIDYDTNWRIIHKRSIESAYRSAPFYEFYEDDIIQILDKKYKYLFDLNQLILETILKLIEIDSLFTFSGSFKRENDNMNVHDFRNSIHPKKRMIVPYAT